MKDTASIEDILSTHLVEKLDDPRSNRNQRHSFVTLVSTSFLCVLSGIDSFSGMQDFVECHFDELIEYFDFPGNIPSHDTYRRLWGAIDPQQFLWVFQDFIEILKQSIVGIVNIDGKTIRNSGKLKPLHIVSAWCKENQLVLAQEKVDQKSNEITAIPKLLKLLDLRGCTVTIDAIGAQRDICEQITQQGGEYVIALKGNQGTLHEDIQEFFGDTMLLEACLMDEDNDKQSGRVEQRVAYSTTQIDWLQETHKWPGLKSIGMVRKSTIRKGKEVNEARFYISSLEADAAKLNKITRSHWSIENQLHWRLDVIFNEDKACIRNENAAENLNIMRKWALSILQRAKDKPHRSLKSVMRKNCMSLKHLINSVKTVFHA